MDLISSCSPSLILAFVLLLMCRGASGAVFMFVNKCDYSVWPGILANAGSPTLDSTGFELPTGSSRSFQAPTGWSGRFWGRTGCNFDAAGQGICSTGDCGSGQVECNGAGAAPPATLAEFTLGSGTQDFYDVSLVDGYNLPMMVDVSGGTGTCSSTGCITDLNRQCPTELRLGNGDGCKSACEAFGSPEYCCSGAFNAPSVCRPSVYSEMFKSACPRSYSYAYDDATSTFTCSGADYIISFCPSSGTSLKNTRDSTPTTGTTTDSSGSGMVTQSGTDSGSGASAMLADTSMLAALATGDSTRTLSSSALQSTLITAAATALILHFLHLWSLLSCLSKRWKEDEPPSSPFLSSTEPHS
ncbi:thaumatin-like protein 1 [Macadamia integrifolia]|uniref:thaumatin-like protein 1 n=1 Tax=Macadamia integrifolia TaxID=60698 RepID=UPI001C4ECDDF|nr:thaumatin-like protein 1 [Macadamia integrifolia]